MSQLQVKNLQEIQKVDSIGRKLAGQLSESYISTSENLVAVLDKVKEIFTSSKYMQFVYDGSRPGYVKCLDYMGGAISYSFN